MDHTCFHGSQEGCADLWSMQRQKELSIGTPLILTSCSVTHTRKSLEDLECMEKDQADFGACSEEML